MGVGWGVGWGVGREARGWIGRRIGWFRLIRRLGPLLGGALLLAVASTAIAAGRAAVNTWDAQGTLRRSEIDFAGDRMRIESQALPQGALLFRDGQGYLVSRLANMPVVVDLPTLLRASGSMVRQLTDGVDSVREFISLADGGRTETVAGIAGRVHLLDYRDAHGQRWRAELVLTHDARVVEFTRAFRMALDQIQRAAGLMAPAGTSRLIESLNDGRWGVLRFADRYTLVAIAGRAPPAVRFELPAQPMALPDLGPLLGR